MYYPGFHFHQLHTPYTSSIPWPYLISCNLKWSIYPNLGSCIYANCRSLSITTGYNSTKNKTIGDFSQSQRLQSVFSQFTQSDQTPGRHSCNVVIRPCSSQVHSNIHHSCLIVRREITVNPHGVIFHGNTMCLEVWFILTRFGDFAVIPTVCRYALPFSGFGWAQAGYCFLQAIAI